MITIGRPVETRAGVSRTSGVALASLLLHLCLLSVLIIHRHALAAWIAPVRLPGTDQGTHYLIAYLPGKVAPHLASPHVRPQPQPADQSLSPLPPVLRKPDPAPPSVTDHPSDQPDATKGEDARGSGKVNIAYTTFSPSPRPDLSALPRGTRGDVILDIVIDPTGKIADIKMASGLGHGVDETVIATVQSWTFHPATLDGKPVASEQELHFHYETRG